MTDAFRQGRRHSAGLCRHQGPHQACRVPCPRGHGRGKGRLNFLSDRWCVCALRWREAYENGCAPPVVLESTHAKALEYVLMEWLRRHAVAVQPQG